MKLSLRRIRRPQGQRVIKKLNVSKLKVEQNATDLSALLDSKLSSLHTDSDVEKEWASFKAIVLNAALQTFGPATSNHQDWFDECDAEIQILLEEKRRLVRAH